MKKFLHNPITISVTGGIIVYIIIGIKTAIAEKTNLVDSLLDLPGKIYHMKIPDFILVVFIVAILIALVLMNKKFKGLSPKEFEGIVQSKKERKIEIKNEHILVLSMLANTRGSIEFEDLFDVYRSNFSKKEKKDFRIIINDLEGNELIEIAEEYENGECYYRITAEGLHILSENIT